MPIRRAPDVIPLAFLLHCESGRYGRSDVAEIQQHAIAETLDEMSVPLGQHVFLDVFDELEPAFEDAFLVLLDEANGLDHIDDEYRVDAAVHQSSPSVVR